MDSVEDQASVVTQVIQADQASVVTQVIQVDQVSVEYLASVE